MKSSAFKRSEEARRQAQAVMTAARKRQAKLLQERASILAREVRKVMGLRAQRLKGGEAEDCDAGGGPRQGKRKATE